MDFKVLHLLIVLAWDFNLLLSGKSCLKGLCEFSYLNLFVYLFFYVFNKLLNYNPVRIQVETYEHTHRRSYRKLVNLIHPLELQKIGYVFNTAYVDLSAFIVNYLR